MEPDRVEMSVGSGMVNGDHLVNGIAANGSSINTKPQGGVTTAVHPAKASTTSHTNGEITSIKKEGGEDVEVPGNILQDAPAELLQALSAEYYLPMARLISRSAQSCWNDLASLVEQLATMPVQNSSGPAAVNDQSKANLEKKDLLLNFAKDHKDIFIKLMVLLQWSRRSEDVRKTIELNLWLQQRRLAFNNATGRLGAMMRGLADSQVPNPDLYTASEVLATGTVSSMPRLDYVLRPPLTPKQILRIFRQLDIILCTRMSLAEDIPRHLQSYHIHDGRVTFTSENKFSFDVSVASEDPQAKFGMVDFAFLFSPAPSIPDGLRDEIVYIANSRLDKEGFGGVYDFLHDLTLSYKVNEFAKQARKLSNGLFNGHLKVEVLRRTLVVQYWLKNSNSKSWLEIGIHSGRTSDVQKIGHTVPELSLIWHRDGKICNSEDISINLSTLSFEDILRQVIAQHTNCFFDAIYDKLVTSLLYKDGELELNQSASSEDPAECVLEVQLSKMDVLHVSMEPIGGSLVLSPVNERISRLQHDLSRSKSMVEDFVSRIAGLRSSTAESNLLKSLPNSDWQRLESTKSSMSEAEKLFGQPVSRISLIRQPNWGQDWMLAVTQSAIGDIWWLTQNTQPNSIVGSRVTAVVKNHPLYMIGPPSPGYLERLADYTTGVITLHCNAEFLNKNKFTWRLPDIQSFDGESRLPALQFSWASGTRSADSSGHAVRPTKKDIKSGHSEVSYVHLTYHGVDSISRKAVVIAKAALVAEATVLKDLASSKLDQSVAIIPEKQQLMIRLQSDPGTPIIDTLVSKLSHLENIVACAAAVKKSTEHTLQNLSLSSLTILYHRNPDLSLRINFGQRPSDLSAVFAPAQANPQRHLSQWVVKSMNRKGYHSSQNLSNIFVVLRMTRPMLSYLQNIQSPVRLDGEESPTGNSHLRVHILHRQPAAYGLHYFATSSNFVRDETGPGTPRKLLARFEILAMHRGDRLMWMVRPAIEEFSTYNRPSYTSNALRDKLNRDIFKRQSPLWLSLDGGAACPAEKPEQLLSAIHRTIVEWAKEAVKPEPVREQNANTINGPSLDAGGDKKSNKSNPTPQPQPPKPPNHQRPNGIQRPQQQMGQQKSGPFNNRNQGTKSEVIMID